MLLVTRLCGEDAKAAVELAAAPRGARGWFSQCILPAVPALEVGDRAQGRAPQ